MNSDFSLMDSSSAAIVSSSSAPHPWSAHDNSVKSYDVFISFRGKDTRNNFTSHLHDALCRKKIITFVDDELKRGDPISTLFPTIQNSTFAVIVFSKDYASSRWCLDELVKILECKETCRQIVIPVFYNVEPSDVRNRTGNYAKSFFKHTYWKLIPRTTRREWKKALREASVLSGWNSAVTRPDSILTEEIAKDIWKRLKQVYPTANDLVGIDSKVKVIESRLRSESREVCVVGIWGIGGIGKTTLARFIFDKISGEFEGACFIEDIGRLSKNDSPLLGPRQELCAAILGEENIKTGICNIGLPSRDARFYRKKLLVVFDDVTHTLQIEKLFGRLDIWPNTGSRFIITTRDKKVLHWCNQKEIYKLEGLLKDESLQLFSQYAFKQEVPMVEYIGLSIKIVKYAKGIPLVLKVLGGYLYGKEMHVWESAIEKLERIPNKEIQDMLQISYDGLDEDQKEIFLDIACFDFMDGWESVVDYFDACGFKATVDLDILADNCLIDKVPFQGMSLKHDVQPKKGIRMHDLLRGMGREIVRKESIDDPSKRSRLWHHEDIYRVLRRNKGTEAIKGISLDISMINGVNLQMNVFKKMKNLRFLKIYYPTYLKRVNKVHTPCGANFVLYELRYFQWDGYPLKSLQPNFNPENLVAIHIFDSDIEQLWEDDQALSKLRKLRLYRCNKLTSIPSLSSANCLDTLEITACSSLRSLSPPAHLRSLNINGCSNLVVISELPSTVEWFYLVNTAVEELSCISHLSRLKTLHIENSSKLKCLSDDIYEVKSLVHLRIRDCGNFYTLPHDLGSLEGLVTLNVSKTAIEELPSSIGCLSRLEDLQLTNAKLKCLPSSICKLKSLGSLDLNGNKELQRLPDDLGSLKGLVTLNVSETAVEELPYSVWYLSKLSYICLSGCLKLKYMPSSTSQYLSLDRSSKMRQLSLIGCYNLDWQLPREVMEDVLLKSLILKGWERCWLLPSFVIYPSLKIPEWFSSRNVGYSVTLTLPKESSNGKTILFAFSVVVDLPCEDIGFCYELEYKDGQAQDGIISGRNRLISHFAKCAGTSKFEGRHVAFGYSSINSPIPISDLQSAVLACEFYVYKKNESGEEMKCYTVEECGIHHVSPNQNKHIRSYGFNDKE